MKRALGIIELLSHIILTQIYRLPLALRRCLENINGWYSALNNNRVMILTTTALKKKQYNFVAAESINDDSANTCRLIIIYNYYMSYNTSALIQRIRESYIAKYLMVPYFKMIETDRELIIRHPLY